MVTWPWSSEHDKDLRASFSNSQLVAYREAVGDVVEEAARVWHPTAPVKVEEVLAERLQEHEFAAVHAEVDGGTDAVTEAALLEVRNYRPSERSSASDLPSLVRIYLLSQIDSAWWARMAPFERDEDVLASTNLVDLDQLRSAGQLNFQYRTQPVRLPGRVRAWVRRRVSPESQPRTAGLRFALTREPIVAVLNQLAAEFASRVPVETPRLWATSLVRSVQHQHRLRALGYAALLPSAHCVGYACDVEMHWFRRFDQHHTLRDLLLDRQESGQLNVIDEGQAWHLCVNPSALDELRSAYLAQVGAG